MASGLATLAAAWGASYLGVYGTILGAAFMSVASTAGAAVGKHYLDQGRDQLREMTHLQDQQAARDAAARATSADPTRTVSWPGDAGAPQRLDDPNATRLDPSATRLDPAGGRGGERPGDPNATRVDGLPVLGSGDPNVTRMDGAPTEVVANTLAAEAGEEAVKRAASRAALENTKQWLKQRWVVLAVSSAAVFALVIGGIAIFEWRTGEAFGNSSGKVSNAFTGGGTDEKPDDRPSDRTPSGEPSGTPSGGTSGEPTPTPSDGGGQDGQTPTPEPSTPNPTPTPDKSTPTTPGPSNSAPNEESGTSAPPPAQQQGANPDDGS